MNCVERGKTLMALKEKKIALLPLMKYPGGKGRELYEILPNLPPDALNFYEPFVGGGAVYFAVDSENYFINDKSTELMGLYEMIAKQNRIFFARLERINYDWILMSNLVKNHYDELTRLYYDYRNDAFDEKTLNIKINQFVNENSDEFNGLLLPDFSIDINNFIYEVIRNIKNKLKRMKKLELRKGSLTKIDLESNFESAFKSAFYMHFRYLYNNVTKLKIEKPYATAIYYFIREYCYSSMYRYNSNGEFNVPYGGISYNKKNLTNKIAYFKKTNLIGHLKATIFGSYDFKEFLKKYPPNINDFMFLDPPYDTEFSTYANNKFGQNDQARLAEYLINDCDSYFMLVIKDTELIRSLYPDGIRTRNNRQLRVRSFDKQYIVSFQNRNDRDVTHLVITNY